MVAVHTIIHTVLQKPCVLHRCQNGASCVIDSSEHDGFVCVCSQGHEGKFCEIKSGKNL